MFEIANPSMDHPVCNGEYVLITGVIIERAGDPRERESCGQIFPQDLKFFRTAPDTLYEAKDHFWVANGLEIRAAFERFYRGDLVKSRLNSE